MLVVDKSGNLFDDRRKGDRRKENIEVENDRRKDQRRKVEQSRNTSVVEDNEVINNSDEISDNI